MPSLFVSAAGFCCSALHPKMPQCHIWRESQTTYFDVTDVLSENRAELFLQYTEKHLKHMRRIVRLCTERSLELSCAVSLLEAEPFFRLSCTEGHKRVNCQYVLQCLQHCKLYSILDCRLGNPPLCYHVYSCGQGTSSFCQR